MSEALDLPQEDERRTQLDLVPDPSPAELAREGLDDLGANGESASPTDARKVRDESASEAGEELFQQARTEAERTPSMDAVRAYLKNIGKVALLTAEEEVYLAKRIEAGLYADKKIQLLKADQTKRKSVIAELGRVVDANSNVARRDDIADAIVAHTKKSRDPELQAHTLSELQEVARDGAAARQHLIEANLRLVVSLAKRYVGQSHGMSFDELIQEGNVGLIRGVEKFDYAKGFKFSTYGTWWIRQAITRAIADKADTIRIPVHMVEQMNKYGRKKQGLLESLGREPTPAELATEMGLEESAIQEIEYYRRMQPVSLDKPLGDGAGPGQKETYLGDLVADRESVTAEEVTDMMLLRKQLEGVLWTLPDREAEVIRLRYGLDGGKPLTLDEIGRLFGLTRERIRQIEKEAMKKLKDPSRSGPLRGYLDSF